jgi:hypothetical protein
LPGDGERQHAHGDQHLDRTLRHRRHAERRRRQRDAVADGESGHGGQQRPRRHEQQQEPENEEEMIGPGQDVLDAEHDVAAHDVPRRRLRGHDERVVPRRQHDLHDGRARLLDPEQRVDARGVEVLHADRRADEAGRAAIDRPAQRHVLERRLGRARRAGLAVRGQHGTHVGAGQAHRRRPPRHVERAVAGADEREQGGIEPVAVRGRHRQQAQGEERRAERGHEWLLAACHAADSTCIG